MTSRQLAQVGLGLIGVWTLLDVLVAFTGLGYLAADGSIGSFAIMEILPFALMLGLSYILVFHNAKLAAAIAPDVDAAPEPGSTDLARILVALLGVMLFARAVPGPISEVAGFLAAGEYPSVSSAPFPLRAFIGSSVQIAIAVYLVARPDRLLSYVRRPMPTPTQSA